MDIFTLFTFVGGLGLFLFGMNVLGEAIGRQAGGKMKTALERITSNKLMGIKLCSRPCVRWRGPPRILQA